MYTREYSVVHVQVTWCFDFDCRKFINCMMWDGKKTLSQRLFKEVRIYYFSRLLIGAREEYKGSYTAFTLSYTYSTMALL